jgi:hypothetical protein
MAAGDNAPQGYATGTPNGYLDGQETGRTVSSTPVVVQRVTHGIGAMGDGVRQVTTPGTRVRLTASSTLCRKVIIQALGTNLGDIVVGGATVVAAAGTQATPTRRGFVLSPNDWQEFEFDDLTDVWLDSLYAADGVSYVYWTYA